jgi:hypothetical protein
LEVEDESASICTPRSSHYIKFEADVKWCSYNILQLGAPWSRRRSTPLQQLGAVGIDYDMLADLVIEQLRDNELEGLRIVYHKQGHEGGAVPLRADGGGSHRLTTPIGKSSIIRWIR